METPHTCERCGRPAEGPDRLGLCPDCLLAAGLGSAADATAAGALPRFTPPAPEGLAPLFPQLAIEGLIGSGGMGAVYKARQKTLDRPVALKILPPDVGRDPAFAARFAREARALARLNHPNIVTLYEFGQAGDLFYFLMEYVDGVSLRQVIRDGRVSPREALAIVPQLCDALQCAHDQGIVHRDIKPENILLDRLGRVKVADFGIAKIVWASDRTDPSDPTERKGQQPDGTHASLVMGTPAYMAPEQRERPAEVDHRADIYSLGVVFYQMLTGELPGASLVPPSRRVQVDVRLDEVVLRALERRPERRYQQASEVKTRCATLAGALAAGAGPAAPAPTPVRGWRWRVAFAALYAAYAALLFATMSRLPARVATHFDFDGRADAWMSRPGYLLFATVWPLALAALLAAVTVLVRKLPARFVNLPRKDYWLAPERRARTAALLRNWMLALGCLMVLFFGGLHVLTLDANAVQPARLSLGGMLVVMVSFLLGLLLWVIALLMRFAEPDRRRESTSPRRSAGRPGRRAREIVIAVVVAGALRQWVVSAYTIKNDSLAPELPAGSYVLAWKLARTYEPGALVVYRDGDRYFAGRVSAATAGEVRVNRNGVPDLPVPRDTICGRIVTVLWRGSGAASPVSVTGGEAVVHGHGAPGQRLVCRIGGQHVWWECAFVNDAGFDASVKPSADRTGVDVWVTDANGLTLLSLELRGAVGRRAGLVEIYDGPGRVWSNVRTTVGTFTPVAGARQVLTLGIEATAETGDGERP